MKSPGRTCSSSVPGDRERHRDAGPRPRAVRRHHGRATGPGRVDEHLAATLLADELRGRHLGSSRAARAASARVAAATSGISASSRSGTNTCTPLAPLVLTPPDSPASSSACRTSSAAATAIRNPSRGSTSSGGSRSRIRWVCRSLSTRHQRRVVLDRPLVGQPHQGPPVVADRVVHLALGGVRPDRGGADPVGGVLRQVLLHERLLAEPGADDGQGAVAQLGEHPLVHGVEVADQVALGRTGAVEDRLVEVRERDTGQRGRVLRALRHGSSRAGNAPRAIPRFGTLSTVAGRDTRRVLDSSACSRWSCWCSQAASC